MKKIGVLLILLVFAGFFVCAGTKDDIKNVGDKALTDDGQKALNLVRDTSDASTGFLKDSGGEIWGSLKGFVSNPIEGSKEIYGNFAGMAYHFIGVTDEDGKNIYFNYYFFGMNFEFFFGWTFIILTASALLALKDRENKWKDKWGKFWRYSLSGFVGSVFVFSAFNRTPFWGDFGFWMVVMAMGFFMKIIIEYSKKNGLIFLDHNEEIQGIAKMFFFSKIVIIFTVLYFLFNSIPILNIGVSIITLEFIGGDNIFFLWIIRPFIIAFLLVFGGKILEYYRESRDKEKKFEKKLKEQAIFEKNMGELKS